MSIDRQQVQEIFLKALELSGEDRTSFLNDQCAENHQLRCQVQALLAAYDDPDSIVSQAKSPLNATLDSSSADIAKGSQFQATLDSSSGKENSSGSGLDAPGETRTFESTGIDRHTKINDRYALLEKIGEGGMGEVWIASQSKPVKRKVAIKLIKAGMDSTGVLQRFEQERQALAIMDHPNIARVLDGGITNSGQPFFVMELVDGESVTSYCDAGKLTPQQRLELFVPICRAVQHAHQKGIVHRDLKPANILISMVDGQPVPKVIDFGVAKAMHGKLTEQTLSTQFGAVVGTLEYMSPEQAGSSQLDVDTRADIYSLGVILYELLTGLRPFDINRLKKAALVEMVRVIQEEEPSKPSTRLSTSDASPSLAAVRNTDPKKLASLLRGELDWIILKCLEKNRERRYETANGLARDIERHLANDPVEARPQTVGYRLQKFLRRNKKLVATVALVSVLLIAGVIGTSLGLIEARRQRKVAVDESKSANLARVAEQQQREIAEKANQQAMAALDSFTSDLMGRILGSKSKITENEKAILQNALRQWDVFAQSKGTSVEAQETRAMGSANVSRIQFKLGMTEAAVASDRKTLQIWTDLSQLDPENREYRLRRANGCQDLGATLRSIGKRKEAAGYFGKAVEEYRILANDNPSNLDFQTKLAGSLISMGNVERDFGDFQASETHYLESLSMNEKLAVAEPNSDLHNANVARSHWGLAFLYRRHEMYDKSKGHYKNTINTYQALADKNKDDAHYAQITGSLYRELGVMLADSGQQQAGAEELRRSLPIQRKLYVEYPSIPNYGFEFSKSLRDLAKALYQNQQFDDADPFMAEAISIQEKLVEEHPDVIQYQSSIGYTLRTLGHLKEEQEKFDKALEAYDRSISILTTAFAQDRSYMNVKDALWQSHELRASLLDRMGRHKEALKDWTLALELSPEEEKIFLRYGRADSLLRSGAVEEAIVEIDKLSEVENSSPEHWFRFAKLYSVASTKLNDRKQELETKSLQLLKRAVELGFEDLERIKKDAELENLKQQDGFQELLDAQTEKNKAKINCG